MTDQKAALRAVDDDMVGLVLDHGAGKQVDAADEVGHEAAVRGLVNLARLAGLQDAPFAHHRDARRHAHRFFLVVRHHHAGHADLLDDIDQFQLGLFTQLLVKRRQRFVQQQQLRPLGQTARQRDALLLAAG